VDLDVRACRCDEAPEPLTMCLELRQDDRVYRLYSSEQLETDEHGRLIGDAEVRAVLGPRRSSLRRRLERTSNEALRANRNGSERCRGTSESSARANPPRVRAQNRSL
jgi:hypothetical protein